MNPLGIFLHSKNQFNVTWNQIILISDWTYFFFYWLTRWSVRQRPPPPALYTPCAVVCPQMEASCSFCCLRNLARRFWNQTCRTNWWWIGIEYIIKYWKKKTCRKCSNYNEKPHRKLDKYKRRADWHIRRGRNYLYLDQNQYNTNIQLLWNEFLLYRWIKAYQWTKAYCVGLHQIVMSIGWGMMTRILWHI